MRRNIRVVHKPLEGVWGWARIGRNTIEVDETAIGKKHLEIVLHEALHILFPNESEEVVQEDAITLTNLLWKLKYRRTDANSRIPLQDGKR